MAFAQPSTEVFLFELTETDGNYAISDPLNISANDGYDNQPAFWPDGKSILYARTVNGQTEIARYFIKSKKTEIITNTLQGSEFSPTPMPDGRISSIRLDTTGLQLLYAYNLKGESEVLVANSVIGYHTWINDSEIVSFVLGQPFTMQVMDIANGTVRVVADSIGRSLHKIPDSNRFSFVDKSAVNWIIKSMDPKSEKVQDIIPALSGSEDYCWTPNGEIIMGQENKIMVWKVGSEWKEIADLSAFDLDGISRLSVSPDGSKLVVVTNQ